SVLYLVQQWFLSDTFDDFPAFFGSSCVIPQYCRSNHFSRPVNQHQPMHLSGKTDTSDISAEFTCQKSLQTFDCGFVPCFRMHFAVSGLIMECLISHMVFLNNLSVLTDDDTFQSAGTKIYSNYISQY